MERCVIVLDVLIKSCNVALSNYGSSPNA
jgi:hypothetical protein